MQLNPKQSKFVNLLRKTLVRTAIFLVIGVYCLFCLIFMTIGNKTDCQRLEQNYVVCQQYKTSLHMMQTVIAQRIFQSSQLSSSLMSYRLTGAEVVDNKLYLQTNQKPILYIANTNGWAVEYPINEVRQFVRGREYAKKTFYLENSAIASSCYLIICLSLGTLIIRTAYHLDRQLIRQLLKS